MSPQGRKALSVELALYHTLHFRRRPPLPHRLSVLGVVLTPSARLLQPRSSASAYGGRRELEHLVIALDPNLSQQNKGRAFTKKLRADSLILVYNISEV